MFSHLFVTIFKTTNVKTKSYQRRQLSIDYFIGVNYYERLLVFYVL